MVSGGDSVSDHASEGIESPVDDTEAGGAVRLSGRSQHGDRLCGSSNLRLLHGVGHNNRKERCDAGNKACCKEKTFEIFAADTWHLWFLDSVRGSIPKFFGPADFSGKI